MRETLYWLRVIRRCRFAHEETVQPLIIEANELTAMLTAGMKRLHAVGLVLLAGFVILLAAVLSAEL